MKEVEGLIIKLKSATPATEGTASIHWDGVTFNLQLSASDIAYLLQLLERIHYIDLSLQTDDKLMWIEINNYLKEDERFKAMKHYRDIKKCDLKEARRVVDEVYYRDYRKKKV